MARFTSPISLLPLAAALAAAPGCRTSMVSPELPPEKEPVAEMNKLLAQVVTDDGYVDYDKLRENRRPLDRYVAWLTNDEIFRGKKTADHHYTWLNAYNMLVLWQVLERDEPDSVLDVPGWIPKGGSGFFYETQFEVGKDWLSLSEIENERIRQKELDIRDHAALNCASRSCPPLRDALYTRADINNQLRKQMEAWVMDDERGVRIVDGKAVFNPIFDWYARDFSFWSAGEDLCQIASEYARGEKARELAKLSEQGCPHDYFEYDWRLNSANPE